MNEDQRKVVIGVLMEAASTSRRSLRRYKQEAGDELKPVTERNFIDHAEACEAGVIAIRQLTLPG